jgi:hypothetical protein
LDISDDYYAALGKFVHVFASTEAAMFVTLCLVSRIDLRTFQALLSGTRARSAMDYMRRLYEVRHEAFPKRLDEALGQFSTINTVRDLILHSGTQKGGGGLEVSNALRAHATRSLRTIPMSPKFLAAMTEDLHTISAALETVMYRVNSHQSFVKSLLTHTSWSVSHLGHGSINPLSQSPRVSSLSASLKHRNASGKHLRSDLHFLRIQPVTLY